MKPVLYVCPPDSPRWWHACDPNGGSFGGSFAADDCILAHHEDVYIDSCYLGYGQESPHWRLATIDEAAAALCAYSEEMQSYLHDS